MRCCTEAGSYLRLIGSYITQLKAQGPSRTCNESKEEELARQRLLGGAVVLQRGLQLLALDLPPPTESVQGYLAYKKTHPPRTLP